LDSKTLCFAFWQALALAGYCGVVGCDGIVPGDGPGRSWGKSNHFERGIGATGDLRRIDSPWIAAVLPCVAVLLSIENAHYAKRF
jgi:hypothetical protein